jgi:hypothetical protein
MIDLDLESARAAQDIVKNCAAKDVLENVATNTLGVLQENGVFAAILYTLTRSGDHDKAAAEIRRGLLGMAPRVDIRACNERTAAGILDYLTTYVCNDLDRMLLVKQVWEQTLIYTRFSAKAGKAS